MGIWRGLWRCYKRGGAYPHVLAMRMRICIHQSVYDCLALMRHTDNQPRKIGMFQANFSAKVDSSSFLGISDISLVEYYLIITTINFFIGVFSIRWRFHRGSHIRVVV